MTKQVDKNLKFDLNEELTILLTKRAQELAREIYESRISKSQIRNFYDKILEYRDKVVKEKKDFEEVKPFIKMLISKAEYAKGRKVITQEFAQFIKSGVDQIESKEDLKRFQLFFEAMFGFFVGIEGSEKDIKGKK